MSQRIKQSSKPTHEIKRKKDLSQLTKIWMPFESRSTIQHHDRKYASLLVSFQSMWVLNVGLKILGLDTMTMAPRKSVLLFSQGRNALLGDSG